MALVYVQRKGELPWRERRIVAGGYGSVVRYETTHDYVKGWCPECGKWKLFWITDIDRHIQKLWALGNPMPILEVGQATYNGVCTNGHEIENFRPFETPESKRWKRDFTRYDISGRRQIDRLAYLMWRDHFRNLRREAHYRPDHECDEKCPEYDWSYADW